jgi:hypothetical protein
MDTGKYSATMSWQECSAEEEPAVTGEIVSCPHCGKEYPPGSGFDRHKETCAKHPGREVLHAMWKNEELTLTEMSERIGVSRRIVSTWLDEEGIRKIQVRDSDKVTSRTRPRKYREELSAGVVPNAAGGCVKCKAYPYCSAAVAYGVVACEVLDQGQIEGRKRHGVDVVGWSLAVRKRIGERSRLLLRKWARES